MKKTLIVLFLGSLLLSACSQKANVLTEQEKTQGWELLFNGENLDNWKMYNGGDVTGWIIKDNCIVALGKGGDIGGDIITKKQYDNFEVKFDWKASKGGNSGFMYHVIEGENFSAPYVTGPEYQLIDEKGYQGKLEDWQKTGCDYAMYLPDNSKKEFKEAGNWNHSKIIFDNGHVEHWLNGKKILEFEAWTPDWFSRKNNGKWKDEPEYGLSPIGHICLQDHGSEFSFKNLKIKVLPNKEKPVVSLFNEKDLTGWKIYGTEKWYVNKDGNLVCESGEDKKYGYLGTDKYYKDFDLSLEFKQEANGNSGVFIRSTVKGRTVSGWQVEVAPKGHDTGGIYESYGRGWLVQIPEEKENILKEGEWNKMRIKIVGDNITTWLNGTQMVNLKDEKIGKAVGRIALQIHAGGGIKVLWRNLKLKEL